ncbi:cupin-like domain-containing protein [Streptomyces sp. SAS_281]|uniref:cupin-like domain-containing protein n=1 Tax=Streptomyces sp. SAS_281 TaxID=3412744 RepID=UPI00403D34ED
MTTSYPGRDTALARSPLPAHPVRALQEAGVDVRPLPLAAHSSPRGLRQAVRQHAVPQLFRGLADDWPAKRAWQPERLRERYGHHRVRALMNLPGDGVLFPQDQQRYERDLSFAAFLDAMAHAKEDTPCYLAYQRAGDLLDLSECEFGALLGPADTHEPDTRAWIGSAGTRSMLHADLKDNLFCQLSGEKQVTLLSWRDSAAAYPFPDNLVNSQIDVCAPDLAVHPKLRDATFYSGVVRPGDIVYIPRGCWHDIRALTPSVSVNHWFGTAQRLAEYLVLLGRLGPRYWARTGTDFVRHGVLGRREETRFFFSPPSTGKRLYQALRTGNFSHDNDPST